MSVDSDDTAIYLQMQIELFTKYMIINFSTKLLIFMLVNYGVLDFKFEKSDNPKTYTHELISTTFRLSHFYTPLLLETHFKMYKFIIL